MRDYMRMGDVPNVTRCLHDAAWERGCWFAERGFRRAAARRCVAVQIAVQIEKRKEIGVRQGPEGLRHGWDTSRGGVSLLLLCTC